MTNPASERFYDDALKRIRIFLLVLGATGAIICFARFGTVVGSGFVLGASISYINHVWLERVVGALGERITSAQSQEKGGVVVARAVLRYAFLAVGAYVIFKVSLAALYGFLAGVCLTIAAVVCEAVVEIYVGIRRRL